jgi:deoxyribodipyrimidine photo-lyase
VPELERLPDRWIHRPWEAPGEVLAEAGVTLGEAYPAPVVDHATRRAEALAAWKALGG